MVGIRALPVRSQSLSLTEPHETLRNKFLESHIRISYLALTPTIESQGTPSFFIELGFSKPSSLKNNCSFII